MERCYQIALVLNLACCASLVYSFTRLYIKHTYHKKLISKEINTEHVYMNMGLPTYRSCYATDSRQRTNPNLLLFLEALHIKLKQQHLSNISVNSSFAFHEFMSFYILRRFLVSHLKR